MPDDPGTLYVLANRDHSLAKVGLSRTGTPDARASAYERAHGIAWHVYWSVRTERVAEVEARVHRELDICRFALVPGATEVFHCTPRRAVAVARRYVVPLAGAQRETPSPPPLWGSRLERITEVALLIIACWPAAHRLYRRVRIAARELHALLRS
jgi:hypothetical protein